MNNILSISDLTLNFISKRNQDESLFLFRNLSASVPEHAVTALVGGNGSGKTTLFNVISGIQKGASGSIRFREKEISGLPAYRIARMGIGRLFQGARVFDELSIIDNMLLGAGYGRHEWPFYNLLFPKKISSDEKLLAEKAAGIFSSLFGADNYFWNNRNEAAACLSFGQQRLLALAVLLMSDYDLYLLDEPTAGVNIRFMEQIGLTIERMNHKKTVLLIEHNMQFVRQIAGHCLFMNEGHIVAEGSPVSVLDNPDVQKIYLGF